jgi:hypothetical protein
MKFDLPFRVERYPVIGSTRIGNRRDSQTRNFVTAQRNINVSRAELIISIFYSWYQSTIQQ